MITGLEIAVGAVRAARAGRPGAHATRQIELPFENGRLPAAGLVKALGATKGTWGVAVPSSWCCFRTVTLPYDSPARVASTFRYALEGRVPGAVEDYCIDALSELRAAGDKGCRMLVAACPKEKLCDLLAELKEAGIAPCVAQPAILALSRRLRSAIPNGLLLRIDSDAELAVIQKEEMVAADSLSLPADGLKSAEAVEAFVKRVRFALKAMELANGSFVLERCILIASERKRPCEGSFNPSQGSPDDNQPCEGPNKPSQGGPDNHQPCKGLNEPSQGMDIRAALSRALGIPVEPLPEQFGDAAFAAAAGIAEAAGHKPHLASNLLQGELAPQAHSLRYERRVAVALALAIGIVLLLGVRTLRQFLEARTFVRDCVRMEEQLYREALPGRSGAPSLKALEEALAVLEKEAAGGSGGSRVSALALWTELRRRAPADAVIESVDITQKMISLRARVAERGKVWDFKRALAASALLEPGDPKDLRTAEGGATTFSLEARYK